MTTRIISIFATVKVKFSVARKRDFGINCSGMRKLLFLLAISALVLFAQGRGRGPAAPPKNLKVLTPAEITAGAMRNATTGLGVMCTYCHVDDRSSDEKPEKLTARMMFSMVKDINAKFPDGKAHVNCFTCHRGAEMPLIAPPTAAQ
jgi:hypothetical protein